MGVDQVGASPKPQGANGAGTPVFRPRTRVKKKAASAASLAMTDSIAIAIDRLGSDLAQSLASAVKPASAAGQRPNEVAMDDDDRATARQAQGMIDAQEAVPAKPSIDTAVAWARFDAAWYLLRYPDAGNLAGDDPERLRAVYREHGRGRGDSPNALFDERYYLLRYLDVGQSVRDGTHASGFDHYCNGGYKDRSPHWLFDNLTYQNAHPAVTDDVLVQQGFVNRYHYYLELGCRDGHRAHLLLDPSFYRAQLPPEQVEDLPEIGAFHHFLARSIARKPEIRTSPYFDPAWYRARYPEVAEQIDCGIWSSALHHYLSNNTPCQFDPLEQFSERFYREQNPDVAAAVDAGDFRTTYEHFLRHGVFETRPPSSLLDLRRYVSENREVRWDIESHAVRDAFEHYLTIGLAQKLRVQRPATAQSIIPARGEERAEEKFRLSRNSNKAVGRELQALRIRQWLDQESIRRLESELEQARLGRQLAEERNVGLADDAAAANSDRDRDQQIIRRLETELEQARLGRQVAEERNNELTRDVERLSSGSKRDQETIAALDAAVGSALMAYQEAERRNQERAGRINGATSARTTKPTKSAITIDQGFSEKLQAEIRTREMFEQQCAALMTAIAVLQRRLLQGFATLDPELTARATTPRGARKNRAKMPQPETALSQLSAAVECAVEVGSALAKKLERWRAGVRHLEEQAREQRAVLERAIGDRDRAVGRLEVMQPMAGEHWAQVQSRVGAIWRMLDQIAGGSTAGDAPGMSLAASLSETVNHAQVQLVELENWLRPLFSEPSAPAADTLPLVSIVLPVYNQADLVGQAIGGVLSQTYTNWELIIVDDGSTDDLAAQVRRYADEPRILFLRQENQKLPAALNNGFRYSTGELLTWTSADNIMLPMQLERLVQALAAQPHAGLAYSDYWAIDGEGKPLDDPDWRPHNRDLQISGLIRLPDRVTPANFHLTGDNFIGPSFIYRRQVAEIVGHYGDQAFGAEDYDFWLRLHLVTEFCHVGEPLYKYRVHENTLSARATELGLHENSEEIRQFARWCVEILLAQGALTSAGSLLRPIDQFHAAIVNRCRPVTYSDLARGGERVDPDEPLVVDVDLPVRLIDQAILADSDILLCRSELSCELLRDAAWTRGQRILIWDGEMRAAIQHAYIQAVADKAAQPASLRQCRNSPRIDERFTPRRVLMLVDTWGAGGLEHMIMDIARSLAGSGCTVFIAAANGKAPPELVIRKNHRVQTTSFQGDEAAFATFLRDHSIEIINYHHSLFGLAVANELAKATVYTVHNCYLWMDGAARQRIARGLANMGSIIAVSRQVAQFALAQFDYPAERISVVPNGIPEHLEFRDDRPAVAHGAPFTIVMVGSFTPLKLHHVAIAAFLELAEQIPVLRLRLIGAMVDENCRRELQARIAANPHGDRIEIKAGLTRAATIEELRQAHVFILPSAVEGWSVALIEAIEAGCVCIVSDIAGSRELQVAGGSLVVIPSPLGELDHITQKQFYDSIMSDLPEHRQNLVYALRMVWQDYERLARGVPKTRARANELCNMQAVTEGYLRAYAMARHRTGLPCSKHAMTLGPMA